jgi:hypothetical protein
MPHHAIKILLTVAVLFAVAPSVHGSTLYVANNGLDGVLCLNVGGCGSKAFPCRSITRAICNAVAGDTIVVGPGRYGDLDGDGTPGETGEEIGSPGCGCMLSVNKPVKLRSSEGAAATVIDAHTVDVIQNVLIIADGGAFGQPGQGFTVTNTARLGGGAGIVIDSTNVKVRGNQLVVTPPPIGGFPGAGIATVDATQTILIEGNQVIGWFSGIEVHGAGKTVSKNQVSLSGEQGISATGASVVVGNVVTASDRGIHLMGAASAVGNAVYGNREGIVVAGPFSGSIEKNNVFGNKDCGLAVISGASALAAHNYWGAPTGPGSDPADDVCTLPGSTFTVTPFATHPFSVNAPIKP